MDGGSARPKQQQRAAELIIFWGIIPWVQADGGGNQTREATEKAPSNDIDENDVENDDGFAVVDDDAAANGGHRISDNSPLERTLQNALRYTHTQAFKHRTTLHPPAHLKDRIHGLEIPRFQSVTRRFEALSRAMDIVREGLERHNRRKQLVITLKKRARHGDHRS